MENGANGIHMQLRKALENYIKSQYFGKSPILLSAMQDKLDQEGVLYQKPYIESSFSYKQIQNGIQLSDELPDWLKDYFEALSNANLGVYESPFCHQILALKAAFKGQDVLVSTGTGSGKTECFTWPLMAKLALEARTNPDQWGMRGVRTIIMYPMNALVADQISRLRRLIGDPNHQFIKIFRDTCGKNARRPQFGMYTGRTPYAGKESRQSEDRSLAATYADITKTDTEEKNVFLQKLIKDGKLPAKEDFNEFIEKIRKGKHIPNEEDAELVTRFEMQQFCPDILITNYSMLEYMLLRPREHKIWADTQAWLNANSNNKLLFVIDEAHMYRGSAGGEVSLLIRRLFHRLGIDRNRVQFILTTASMPDNDEDDRRSVTMFANELTASDEIRPFCYLTGKQEEIGNKGALQIPFRKFKESLLNELEGNDSERLIGLNRFWADITNSASPFKSHEEAYQWLYVHLADYAPFCQMFKLCRGTAVSLQELAESIFPDHNLEEALQAVSVMLAMAPLGRSDKGNVLFPARMHMLFRGIKGVYACTNPECSHSHTDNGLTLGEVYFTDGNLTCKECGSTIYELYNDRRCGSIFFRGFILKQDFEARKRTYLWHQPGMMNEDEVEEIHLFIPSEGYRLPKKQGQNKILPCYLDVYSGFVDFSDDSLDGKSGIRKLYYSSFTAKSRPDILTFSTCPHCRHELSKMQLTSFNTKGNQSFFNLIKAQFQAQPAVPEKTGFPDLLPNEGRKVLLFSDSRQRAAKLARDMSDASDMAAARQIAALAINRMEHEETERSMNYLYDYFAMVAKEHYVYRKGIRTCSKCGWFGLEADNHDFCPFCGNKELTDMLPMLRPWGFAPRDAVSIETAQLNEEYTATQQPLYSTLPEADDVTSITEYSHIRMAVRSNQRIIMINKGDGNKGFTICCDCGAIMPGNDPIVLKDVMRPYRSKFIKAPCKHSDTLNVNLGFDFVTDMLVLEFALDREKIDSNPTRNSWINRAGQSLAEALRLAVCKELDIEFAELVTGYRVRKSQNGDFVDVYLYDSLSSGAGYAVSIASFIEKLLVKTRELLANCTCDNACHKCLKHYQNQYIHGTLDRKAALDLLNWGETGIRSAELSYETQRNLLHSLEQILQLSGVCLDMSNGSIWAKSRYARKKITVYPAMWKIPKKENTIFVSDTLLIYAKPYALKTILDDLVHP